MLPSTGYFKALNCPFYDSGFCERPYCHFRHYKKDTQSLSNNVTESGTMLQQLVSKAVKKVLEQTEEPVLCIVKQTQATDENINKDLIIQPQKHTYNPTPISELKKINSIDTENDDSIEQKKRHIPVPYTPRKPISMPIIKRTVEDIIDPKVLLGVPQTAQYLPGSVDGPIQDPYLPIGGKESKEKYLPGSDAALQEYKPIENKSNNSTSKLNYIPSGKNVVKKKVLEYKPSKVNPKSNGPRVTYEPTPLSQVPCFSSDEDEPRIKKRKLSADLNSLDELNVEFDMLGQILDEEKLEDDITHENKDNSVDENAVNGKHLRKAKYDKEKTSSSSKHDRNSKSEERKSSNKSSSREKVSSSLEKEKRKERRSKDKERDKDRRKDRDKKKSSKKEEEKIDKHKDKKLSKEQDKSTRTKSKDKNRNKEDNKHSDKNRKSEPNRSEKDCKVKNSQSSKSNSKSHKKESSTHRKSKEKHKHESVQKKVDLFHNESDDDGFDDKHSDEICEELSEDEESIALECKRIFEEYVPTEKPKVNESVLLKDNESNDEYISAKKRVSRTIDKNIKILTKDPIKPDYKVSAAQKMAERLNKVKEFHASRNITSNNISINSTPNPVSTGKIRIAHVPYASTLLNAKKSISKIEPVQSEPCTSTITQTVKKGTQRLAHIPNDKFIDRPGVLEPLASKIPANIRSTYLNLMIDECIKIYLSSIDAYARAQHEELATSKKCKSIQIYKNSAAMTVSRLRKEILESKGVKKSGSNCASLQKLPSYNSTASSSSGSGSWSIENKNKRAGDVSGEFKGSRFYENISKWILDEEQLQNNGFPRVHPSGEKGKAMIYVQNNKQKLPKGIYRTCCRCKKEYAVDKKGFPNIKEECIYHPNNKYKFRGEVRYQCCSQDGTSDGCCIASSHVYEYVDYDNLRGYVKTLPPETGQDIHSVYSLDCEMCYTTHGLDLTRITVINSDCKVVYETLIKPLHPIIDYNTRYSGITEEQMANVKTTLLEVQATLLSMFNSKTILIGHSLESDFKALKLIHDSVIDTSVLFPHKMGPPYKRALRNLSSEYLKKIIQNSVDGHDSAEDATVCMELLHYKLKEDLKTR